MKVSYQACQIKNLRAFLANFRNKFVIILPVEVKVLSLVFVLVAVAVEAAEMLLLT